MLRRGTRLIVYVSSVFLFWFIAAAGAALAVATFWRRIVSFFRRDKGKGAKTGEGAGEA